MKTFKANASGELTIIASVVQVQTQEIVLKCHPNQKYTHDELVEKIKNSDYQQDYVEEQITTEACHVVSIEKV